MLMFEMSFNTETKGEISDLSETSQNSISSEICELFCFDDDESFAGTPSLEYYYEPSIKLGDIKQPSDCENMLHISNCHCKGCRCHIVPLQGHCHRCNCYQESGTTSSIHIREPQRVVQDEEETAIVFLLEQFATNLHSCIINLLNSKIILSNYCSNLQVLV